MVYSYQKTYLHAGALEIEFTCFEQTPPKTSRCGFAFTFDTENAQEPLFAVASPDGQVALLRAGAPFAPALQGAAFAGEDEQGHYWGVRFTLDEALLQSAFPALSPEPFFTGNFMKFWQGQAAFGTAFPLPDGAHPLSAGAFGEFVPVPY